MVERLLALIVDESRWLPLSMGLALVPAAILLFRHRRSDLTQRQRIAAVMNLFVGVTIGTMACGHFLAVTTKLAQGTLQGNIALLYPIGILVAAPSWALIHHAWGLLGAGTDGGRRTVFLNAWLAVTLLALGIHNLPLAVPAFFNIGYQLHSRRVIGRAIVGVAVAFNLALFIGSLIFLASGQTFEEFTGMR